MLITPAYAQGVGGAGGPDLLMSILPFILIFVIYDKEFLISKYYETEIIYISTIS